jgi:hypothetical protein
MDRRLVALIAVAIAVAVISTSLVIAFAQAGNNKVTQQPQPVLGKIESPRRPCNATPTWTPLHMKQRFRWFWGAKAVEISISDEFKQKVISILQSDPDTATLLAQGYNITRIVPIKISAVIGGDGTVTLKVTKVAVVLSNGAGSKAVAVVDIEKGSVVALYKFEAKIKTTTTTTTTPTTTA